MKNATIGAAVLGGYLLGRTKKAKLALGAGALLAGAKARPGQLAGLLDSPFLSNVTQQVRGELTEAGKAAATSVLTAKADSLAGALHERTEGLRERAHPDGGEPKGDDERTEPDDQQDDQQDEQKAQDEPDAESGGGGGKGRSGGGSQRRSTASRAKEQTASAGRTKSGSGSRSRRQDDG
ncbi:ABC transporter substrate-binding protein [Streptomyces sp. JV178]|uniref:ABC transporter substrate-binding protein n=1 Tax=Streptomyces sp. JV178 TaxID=858632 RepID=UPI000C1B5D99|nr:ABC transporter substrate-binding protein [Streptomyces sp. JV178]PIM67669.1 ABC transporter substrate-binding protein [Streptomyces sp. JV178]